MRRRLVWLLALPALALAVIACPGLAEQSKGDAKEAAEAVAKKAGAFVKAFHMGDAQAPAAFWTTDGDFTDQTGWHLKGRKAIERAFQRLFSEHTGGQR